MTDEIAERNVEIGDLSGEQEPWTTSARRALLLGVGWCAIIGAGVGLGYAIRTALT